MKAKHVIFVFLLSFALLIAGGWIRSHGFIDDIPVSQILFAITAFVLVRKGILKGKWMYYVLPFLVLFWHTFAFFFDNIFSKFHEWEYITTGTPNILLCAVGATYGALLASKTRLRIAGIVLFLLCAVCSAWYMTRGIEYWINYCSVGSFTGKVEEGRVDNWQQVVNPSDTLQRDHYKDKYVVLDFWSMSCVVCFKKFPKLDSLNRQYKDNSEVLIEAVYLPQKDDSLKFERTRQLNEKYTFRTVFADSSAARIFHIDGVPTVIILKNDDIVFRGSIELAQDFLNEHLIN